MSWRLRKCFRGGRSLQHYPLSCMSWCFHAPMIHWFIFWYIYTLSLIQPVFPTFTCTYLLMSNVYALTSSFVLLNTSMLARLLHGWTCRGPSRKLYVIVCRLYTLLYSIPSWDTLTTHNGLLSTPVSAIPYGSLFSIPIEKQSKQLCPINFARDHWLTPGVGLQTGAVILLCTCQFSKNHTIP